MQLRRSNLTWQVVDDESVVLDLEGSVYLRLDGSGRMLWEQLDGGSSAEQLAPSLVDEYGIDAARAESDVAAFLDNPARRGADRGVNAVREPALPAS